MINYLQHSAHSGFIQLTFDLRMKFYPTSQYIQISNLCLHFNLRDIVYELIIRTDTEFFVSVSIGF